MMWENLLTNGRNVMVENGTLKLVAFLLMLVVYFWVQGDREVTEAFYAKVRVQVPEKHVLVSPPLDRVKIQVRGRWSVVSRFDEDQLEPIPLLLSPNDDGQTVALTTDMVPLPPGMRVINVQPNRYLPQLERKVSKRVALKPNLVGEPPKGYILGEVSVQPSSLEIFGPKSLLGRTNYLRTQSLDVSDKTASFERRLRLAIDDARIEFDPDVDIRVRVTISTPLVERTLEDIPVEAVNTSYEATITPSTVRVSVKGPEAVLKGLKRSAILASVDLSAEANKPPGTFKKRAEITNLPTDVELVGIYPTDFKVVTKRPSTPTPAPAPNKE